MSDGWIVPDCPSCGSPALPLVDDGNLISVIFECGATLILEYNICKEPLLFGIRKCCPHGKDTFICKVSEYKLLFKI